MDDKTREILQRPFDKSLTKTRTGPGGKQFTYVEISHYIGRLNEAFRHDWSLEVLRREQFEDQVIVEVRLSADGIAKSGIGGAGIQRAKGDGRILSLADTFKKAEADAIKRAARLLGVGAELYSDEHDIEASATSDLDDREFGPSRQVSSSENGRVSSAQLAKLKELVNELGSEWSSYRQWVREERGISVEYSSRAVASELIGDLIDRVRRNRSAQKSNGQFPEAGGVA